MEAFGEEVRTYRLEQRVEQRVKNGPFIYMLRASNRPDIVVEVEMRGLTSMKRNHQAIDALRHKYAELKIPFPFTTLDCVGTEGCKTAAPAVTFSPTNTEH